MKKKAVEATGIPGSSPVTDQEYFKLFVEDFVNDLVTTIFAGLRGGTIDPGKQLKSPIPKAQASDFEVPPKAPKYTPDTVLESKKFAKLNSLFEAIITEQENEGTLENAIEEFFDTYVKQFGADYSRYKPKIDQYSKDIANDLRKDMSGMMGKLKGGNHVSKATQRKMFELASIAYSVYRLRPQAKAAAPAAQTAPAPAPAPTTTPPTSNPPGGGGPGSGTKPEVSATTQQAISSIGEIRKALFKQKNSSPEEFAGLMNDVLTPNDISNLVKNYSDRRKQQIIADLTKSLSKQPGGKPQLTVAK